MKVEQLRSSARADGRSR